MRYTKRAMLVLLVGTLYGCTTISAVDQIDGDTYIVHASNSGPFRTQDGMLKEAADSANGFCGKQGKRAQVVYTQGFGAGMVLQAAQPSMTLAFRCVP